MNKKLFAYTFIVSLAILWIAMMAVSGFFRPLPYDSALRDPSLPAPSSNSNTNVNRTLQVTLPNSNIVVNIEPAQATYTGYEDTHYFVQFGFPIFINRPVFHHGGFMYLARDGGWSSWQWQFNVVGFLLNIIWIGLVSAGIAYLVARREVTS